MTWTFHPPPGWPPQPEGWAPPPGWTPDPRWPPAPAGWQFWVPAGEARADPAASRPWFTRWWAIAGLVALLVIGSAVGFGGTRIALDLASDSDSSLTNGSGGPDGSQGGGPDGARPATPVGSGSPEAAEPPGPAPPTISPPSIEGAASELCGDVANIMITMIAATAEADDFEAYLDSVVETRRTAAGDLRGLAEDADPGPDRTALEAFASEIEGSAQMVEDDPADQDTFEDSFDRASDAYQTFTDDNC